MKTALSHLGCVCSLGMSLSEICQNLLRVQSKNFLGTVNGFPFGLVNLPFSKRMRCYDLLDATVTQIEKPLSLIKKKYPAHRLGIVLGSSNTGIHEAQQHIDDWMEKGQCPPEFSFEQIELGSPALYLQKKTGFKGPAYVVSTACSSSAKAFSSARNLLEQDICDAVLVGGVDSQCNFALEGFRSLEALSPHPSIPFSKNREGINLGEGAALFIATKDEPADIYLTGIGESSDAYHLTHPEPEGKGAFEAMDKALKDAGISPDKVDYINLHGTGTIANDSMESRAVYRLFGSKPLCASTKPLTGHALGASGAIEAALSWLMLKEDVFIPHIYDGAFDDALPPITMASVNNKREIRTILSNSFAFGGSNASLIFERRNI